MSTAFDVYVAGGSWLHRLDPRVKLLAVALGAIGLLVADHPLVMVLALAATHGALLAASIPWRRLVSIWRATAPLLVIVVVLWPLFDREGSSLIIQFGWFRLTTEALARGFTAALRLAALSFVIMAWLATTSERSLIQAFVRLGVPYRWGVALAIGFRSIPAVAALYLSVADAQQARGLRLDGPLPTRLRAHIPILVATLVATLRLADQMARALDARAFGGPARPTALHEPRMGRSDWLALILLLLVGTIVMALTVLM